MFLVGTSDSFLVRADGRIVASTAADAKPGDVSAQTLYLPARHDAMDAVMRKRYALSAVYANGSQDFYVACAPLNVGGWQVVGIVSVRRGPQQLRLYVRTPRIVLELRLALCAGVILAVAVWLMRQQNRADLRAEKLRLEWSEERYRVLAQDSNEVFWEYDLQENRAALGENFNRLCGHAGDETLEGFLSGVHPNDCPRLGRCSARATGDASSETHATVDVRLRVGGPESTRYLWCRTHMSVLLDARRHRRLVIGKLTDVSQDRLNAERLEKRARTDALTGLLNRAGLEEAIGARLQSGPDTRPCAVVLMDVDDFKAVNDTHGHHVGDEVCAPWPTFCAATSGARTSSAASAATNSWP